MKDILKRCYVFSGLPSAVRGTAPWYVNQLIRKMAGKDSREFEHLICPFGNKHSYPIVAVFGGIGDVLWSFVMIDCVLKKLKTEKIHLLVHDPNPESLASKRSLAMLERFSFVEEIFPYHFNIHANPSIDPETGCYNYIPAGQHNSRPGEPFDYSLCINGYLERGLSFLNIAEQLGLDPGAINHDVFRYYEERPGDAFIAERYQERTSGKYAVFYLGPLVGNTSSGFNRGGHWTPADWLWLGKTLHEEWGLSIILTGASYDLSYCHEVIRATNDAEYADIFINLIGICTLPETLALLRRAWCVVGYPSGIPISSTYLGTRTAMFWRPQHLSLSADSSRLGFSREFATNWVPPAMLESGKYVDCWFVEETSAQVFEKLQRKGWAPPEALPAVGRGCFVPTSEAQIVKYVMEYLLDKPRPIKELKYLDIGAHGPVLSNNSYPFYREGACGVLVEPNRKYAELCRRQRPRDTVLEIGVSYDGSKTAVYYEFDIHDGCNTISENWKEYAIKKNIHISRQYEIDLISIEDIICKYYENVPDIIFIDTEGVDFLIIKTLNLSKYRPIVIVIESNPEAYSDEVKNPIVEYMKKNKYLYVASTAANMIFVDKIKFSTRSLLWDKSIQE